MTEETSINNTAENRAQSPIVSYNEFKTLPLSGLTPGMIVENVNPAKLFASQPDTDSAKINIRMNNGVNSSDNLPPIVPGFVHELHHKEGKDQRILVLGDNHHLTLQRWAQGEKVRVRIVGPLPSNKKIFSFSTLRLNSGHPFREI